MDLHTILSWLMNLENNTRNRFDSGVNTNIHDSVHGTVDQQNQEWFERTRKLREQYPWLFKDDGVGYKPDEMMFFKNPMYMHFMDQQSNQVEQDASKGPMTGRELDQGILQQLNLMQQKRMMNPPEL